jgi:hypothetical protein
MRMRGLLCKTSCRVKNGDFEIRFWKGQLYSAVLGEGGYWWLTNLGEKKRIMINQRVSLGLRKYFKLYQPAKKKSKYERWNVG